MGTINYGKRSRRAITLGVIGMLLFWVPFPDPNITYPIYFLSSRLCFIIGYSAGLKAKGYQASTLILSYILVPFMFMPALGPWPALLYLSSKPDMNNAEPDVNSVEPDVNDAGPNQSKITKKSSSFGMPEMVVIVIISVFIFFGYYVFLLWDAQMASKRRIATQAALRDVLVTEEAYFVKEGKYTSDLKQLDYQPEKGVTIEFISADQDCFKVKATHIELDDTFWADCEFKLYRQRAGSSVLEVL